MFVLSVFFAYHAVQLRPDASFEKMVPVTHPFIANYLNYENELRPLGNVLRIAVHNKNGTIYEAEFLEKLRLITDEVFYIRELGLKGTEIAAGVGGGELGVGEHDGVAVGVTWTFSVQNSMRAPPLRS